MPLATNWAVVWANLWGLGFGLAAGFLAGYAYARRSAHAHAPMHGRKERELGTTTTPDRYWVGSLTDGPGGTPYTITRLVDLGSFHTIDGQPHRHWRVYGRPA
jgi:hypothetical protein